MESMIRTSEAASIIGINRGTLARWVRGGYGPRSMKTPGGMRLFSTTSIEEWIKGLEENSSEKLTQMNQAETSD